MSESEEDNTNTFNSMGYPVFQEHAVIECALCAQSVKGIIEL